MFVLIPNWWVTRSKLTTSKDLGAKEIVSCRVVQDSKVMVGSRTVLVYLRLFLSQRLQTLGQ